MQARISAGASLLAGLTLGFAPPLPARSQAASVSGVSVKSFSYSAAGPFKAGDRIVATLLGTPSGNATFAIPGIVESVPMKELSSGDYVGAYTTPKDISIVGGKVVGLLRFPGIASPLIAASRPITIDSAPPIVSAAVPEDGAIVATPRPYIAAALADPGGVGVDPAKVRIIVDGADVTGRATITAHSVGVASHQPLAAGIHHVSIFAADRLGNSRAINWGFTVAASPPIADFSADFDPNRAVAIHQTVRFTLKGQSGGRAWVNVGAIAINVPLGEGTPGVYTGEYTAQRGDGAGRVLVWAEFQAAGGKIFTAPLSEPMRVDAGQPSPPTITEPSTDDIEVGDNLALAGTARPHATILATVRYLSAGLGGVFPIKGVAGVQRAVADDKGDWKMTKVPLGLTSLLAANQSTVFTIAAATVTADGATSSDVKITARPN